MPNAIEAQIKERIQSFVTELDHLVRQSTLEALQGILAGNGASVRRGRPPGRPRGSGGQSVLVEGVTDSIVAHVRANDGQTVSEIAQGVGAPPAVAKKAIKELLASGALKKTGQKRGTRYHVGSGRPARATSVKRKRRGRRG